MVIDETKINLDIKTPRWCIPLLGERRYKGIKGGRGSGKSHFFAEAVVERMVMDGDYQVVCIREIQKSLKFSAKKLIESKIREFGVAHLFDITLTEIRRIGGEGICIFQGMQDHTADSIKSLEGFDLAWVEEAQSLSLRSLKLLRPTIRKEGSELWFSWNPDQPEDAVDNFFNIMKGHDDVLCVHVNYNDNPFLPDTMYKEMLSDKERYPLDFDHVWLGAYDTKKETRVFSHWRVEECEPTFDDVLYYGADWGFAKDPTVFLRAWVNEAKREIYVDYQTDGVGVEVDDTHALLDKIPEAKKWQVIGDNSRPEMISFLRRQGYNIKGCNKGKATGGKGFVEDGIEFLRSYDIIVHPRCVMMAKELRLHSYKVDKNGQILPKLEDDNNHCIDALRYALESLIKADSGGGFIVL